MGLSCCCIKFLCFLFSAILIHLTVIITAQPKVNTQLFHYCGTSGNYTTTTTNGTSSTSSSAYANNLNQLLSSLSSNASASRNGFINIKIGQDPDTVYGSFLCRGDISNQSCQACVERASESIIQRCPNKKESIIWFDHCMLRYSNRSFFSATQTSPVGYLRNPGSTMDPEGLNRVLENLMDSLVTEAESSTSSRAAYFATKEVNLTKSQTIYGLVQCNPDVSPGSCAFCLRSAIGRIPTCCDRRLGGRVAFPSCNLRYELYPFYESRAVVHVAAPAPSPSPLFSLKPPLINYTKPQGHEENSSRIVVILVTSSAVAAVLLCAITIWLCRRKGRTKQRTKRTVNDMEDITTVESLQFDFEIVRAATEDFSHDNKLGQGGFGAVYKGQLSDGQKIAVKRLSRHSEQGDEEFKNEVVLVAKLQHRNLVRLLGFCFKGEERLLIYEFVPNASLDHFIFDLVKRADLNWETRYKIIGGIARGMLYLHEDSRHRIIHRDLKASNILLDAEMNPKISDFGMARIFVVDQTQGNTSRIVGTYGYMSPEYAMHGHFSVKSDVFSFGVLLLEIVIGQKNSSFYRSEQGEDLLSHAWRRWREGTTLDLIDPTLQSSFPASEVTRCIHIGLLCVQEDAAERPTMGSVAVMLTSHSVSLALPSKPAFYVDRTESGLIIEVDESHSTEPGQASARTRQFSLNDQPITEVYPR